MQIRKPLAVLAVLLANTAAYGEPADPIHQATWDCGAIQVALYKYATDLRELRFMYEYRPYKGKRPPKRLNFDYAFGDKPFAILNGRRCKEATSNPCATGPARPGGNLPEAPGQDNPGVPLAESLLVTNSSARTAGRERASPMLIDCKGSIAADFSKGRRRPASQRAPARALVKLLPRML
jgi:hypothetical protein